MTISNLKTSLLDVAKRLRPVTRSAFIPLLRIAKEWGVSVELRLYSNEKHREAQSDLTTPSPKILLYRRGDTDGVLALSPDREHLLTPRERFSVAHELGHCLAFRDFHALPVLKDVDPKTYREQEACMDDFAANLLVPNWLAEHWLQSVPCDKPVSISSLNDWALKHCAVSKEVLADSLTRVEPSIGFLKVGSAVRVQTTKPLFIVFYSSHGAELKLPNLHSYIDDDVFIAKIQGTSGVRWIEDCQLGDIRCGKLNVAWHESNVSTSRRRREFKSTVRLSGKAFWLSMRAGHRQAPMNTVAQRQLSLFE